MTTSLKWRLGKLPTPDEVLKLLNEKLITKEEARDILFNQETEEDLKTEDLKQEIKFLRELVEKLSTKTETVKIIREIQQPYYHWGWYQPYTVYCGTATVDTSGGLLTTASSGDGSAYYVSGSATGGNAVNAAYTSLASNDISPSNFTDIKTF